MSNGGNNPDPWQLALGKYLIDHAPAIAMGIALAVGGCYESRQLREGQTRTHEILEEHSVKIDEAATAAAAVKTKLEKKEASTPP